ncbi:hypothetical protein UF75_1395 [Desulfosporosinus sp. I2]|nr:hypothetical protein UF75_1395 [Desulfosporosinus sp. I2]
MCKEIERSYKEKYRRNLNSHFHSGSLDKEETKEWLERSV